MLVAVVFKRAWMCLLKKSSRASVESIPLYFVQDDVMFLSEENAACL